MKSFLIVCVFYLLLTPTVLGQKLSPEERADLKMELIQIRQDLSILKAWNERKERVEAQFIGMKAYRDSLLSTYDQLADQLDQTQANIEGFREAIRDYRLEHRNVFEKVYFKVQIQAAARHPLDRFAGRFSGFSIYKEPRLNLYLLGHFYHYQEAKYFSQWLNLKDASSYVVGFKDAQKVRMLYNYIQK